MIQAISNVSNGFPNIHPKYFDFLSREEKEGSRQKYKPRQKGYTKHNEARSVSSLLLDSDKVERNLPVISLPVIIIGVIFCVQIFLLWKTDQHSIIPQMIRLETPQITTTTGSRDTDRKFEAIANVLDYLLKKQNPQVESPPQPVMLLGSSKQSPKQDPQVVEVNVNKANLRVGPGLEHSPLMTVRAGTRLVVEMESNGWYRVIAPNGVRAWVSSSVVSSL